jgi:ATPase subunit of ABC transporter with duplicated ATPase domains
MKMSKQTVVAIMGPTCAGKSTFLNYAVEKDPGHVGLVEVGKMLRAKYPPSYFEGQAAPAKTQKEAWDMCEGRIRDHLAEGKTIVLVDGQPRSHDQVIRFMELGREMPGVNFHFLLLTATEKSGATGR